MYYRWAVYNAKNDLMLFDRKSRNLYLIANYQNGPNGPLIDTQEQLAGDEDGTKPGVFTQLLGLLEDRRLAARVTQVHQSTLVQLSRALNNVMLLGTVWD